MTAKMSARRRTAFLAALRATGNQTIAAERVCVSRSWVSQQRATDPDFRRESDAAIAGAKLVLAMHSERRPPSGWGHLDGVELVVKGSGGSGGGRRVQIARARVGQISPAVEDRFLATLAATCNVKAAHSEAGVSKGAIYTHRKRWPAFAKRWDAAVRIGSLQLQFALVRYAGNPFSAEELPDAEEIEILPVPMRRRDERVRTSPGRSQPCPGRHGDPLMPRRNVRTIKLTPEQAMHNLYVHQYETDRIGRRPGRWPKPPPMAEVTRVILRNIEAIKGAGEVSEAEMAEAEREWRLRRQGR